MSNADSSTPTSTFTSVIWRLANHFFLTIIQSSLITFPGEDSEIELLLLCLSPFTPGTDVEPDVEVEGGTTSSVLSTLTPWSISGGVDVKITLNDRDR
jgi:hypothetical protein